MIRSILIISVLLCSFATTAQLDIVDSLANLAATSDKKDHAGLYNQLGIVLIERQQYEKAEAYLLRALAATDGDKDIQNRLITYKELASASIRSKDYEKTLEYALKLKQLAKKEQNDHFLGYAYAFLSRIKLNGMDDLPEAEVLILKAIELFKKVDYPKGLLSAYNDLAIIYDNKDDIVQSIEQYKKALVIAEGMQAASLIRLIKSNIAGAYVNLEQYPQAEQYNKEALSISVEEKDLEMILYDQLLLGVIQFKQGNIEEALATTTAGGILADSLKDFYKLRESYKLQLKIYKRKKDFVLATRTAEKMVELNNTINQAEQVNRLAKKESEIELLLKDQELLQLEKAADRQYYFRNGIIIIALASVCILYFMYSRKRLLVQMQQKELQHLNTIKAIEVKQKEILKEKLSFQERDLAAKTIDIIQKNEVLSELKEGIAFLETTSNKTIQTQINKLNDTIDNNINIDEDWERFKLHFNKVYPNFFETLKQKYPIFNHKDIRFCTYIKMGLSTKEIAQLTGVNPNSVQKARYRLKKKMNLDRETNLIDFINNIV